MNRDITNDVGHWLRGITTSREAVVAVHLDRLLSDSNPGDDRYIAVAKLYTELDNDLMKRFNGIHDMAYCSEFFKVIASREGIQWCKCS